MSKPRYGPWFTLYRCVGCKGELSYTTMMYSEGRCPLCGFKHPDACTIVECSESAARRVYPSWWNFWHYTIEEKA